MNNKGFTLAELIVTFAVMSVILGMSFAAVANISTTNQAQIYETYENALKTSAKLYVDQYSKDLWPASSDCVKISYAAIRCEDLIKKFTSNKSGDHVDEANSYVNAIRNPTTNKVVYEVHLVINNGITKVYESNTSLTNGCSLAVNSCS